MSNKQNRDGNFQILAAAMITSFMTTFMSSALNLSVPSLEKYFGVNAAYVSWIVSSYTIAVAAMSLPMGKVSDVTSRRKVFLTGISGFGLLSAASIFAPTIGALMVLRALSGTCAAMIFATNNSILISAFPHNVQGKMLGSGTLETSPHTDILRMMHTSFIVFAEICVVGLFFSLSRDSAKAR